jgi:phage-related protein (TIGR01555 family)
MSYNEHATRRLELAARGELLDDRKLDPALRIPRSRRYDMWENPTTGFGTTSQHPVANTQYTDLGKLSSDQLESMYRSDWVARKGCGAPAEDMTRNGVTFKHNDDDLTEEGTPDREKSKEYQKKVEDFEHVLTNQFKLWIRAFEALSLAAMSGGSLTIFSFNDINTVEGFQDPLNENRVSEINWVKTFPAHLCIPLSFYQDINHPQWGLPEHYQVVVRFPAGGVTLRVHESRVIRVDGRHTTQQNRVTNRGWNDSDIQAVYTALRDYGVCVTSSNSTMESFTQDYLGMTGLAEKVMNGETDTVLERIYLAHSKMTSNTLSLYDAESEKMERQGTSVTGLADLWDRYSEAVCGAWGIPRSRFFSSETGSLGGDSTEADTRNYFKRIKSKQQLTLRPYLNSFMSFVNMATGMVDEIPSYDFNDLQEQSQGISKLKQIRSTFRNKSFPRKKWRFQDSQKKHRILRQ